MGGCYSLDLKRRGRASGVENDLVGREFTLSLMVIDALPYCKLLFMYWIESIY